MLYCPKCNQTYEEGVQRFCSNDGVRLVPMPGSSGAQQSTRNVFTSVLNRIPANGERSSKMFTEVPVLAEPEQKNPPVNSVETQDILSLEDDQPLELLADELPAPELPLPPVAEKPAARVIQVRDVPASQAVLGDRAVNPSGREALTWENPEVLLGRTVKGRYVITEKLGEDETGFIYLAEDKISSGKKVVVRVLMEEDGEDLSSRILAEERVSLSHVNHPNVAHLFDSGELHEGFPFIVTEYVVGASLKEKINAGEKFEVAHVARIIRQAASALSEAHRNGVLHRNLKPKNIIPETNAAGAEQVKVTDFGVFDGFEEQSQENLAYLSPEQIQEKYPTFASDIYSLAVIAFQLLTGRLPFEFSTAKELLKAQKEKLDLLPTDLRRDVSPLVNEILEKALAFNPTERYPKARDFGDAFYNALMTAAPSAWKEEGGKYKVEEPAAPKFLSIPKPAKSLVSDKNETVVEEPAAQKPSAAETEIPVAIAKPEAKISQPEPEIKSNKPKDLPWEKRSPEPIKPINGWRIGSIVLGILILCGAVWGIWYYFLHRPDKSLYVPPKPVAANQNTAEPSPETDENANAKPTAEVDAPPTARNIEPPPDTVLFENSKGGLKGDLAKNFRGFSLYYPKDWVRSPSSTSFIDVARIGATGTPIEQITVTYYESKGTMTADEERFPRLVQEANKKLGALISDYRPVSEGATVINGGWKAYELKFQGSGKTTNGDTITLWGRCLWIPPARLDVKSGFLITMLATSNSPDVKSADDVSVKGELAGVLETFEPAPLDTGY